MARTRTAAGQAAADRPRRCATWHRRHKATDRRRYAESGRASARGLDKRRIWRGLSFPILCCMQHKTDSDTSTLARESSVGL